jgi:hypothetical protein
MSLSYGALEAPDEPLLPYQDNISAEKLNEDKNLRQNVFMRRSLLVVASLVAAVIVVIMADVIQPSLLDSKKTTNFEFNKQPFKSTGELTFSSVSNEYGIYDSTVMLPYTFLTDSFLMEPYKESTIVLHDISSECSYDWSFTKVSNNSIASSGTSTDGSIIVTLSSVGEYTFDVSTSCDSSIGLSMTVWVKYVRRELSSLHEADRESFLDAFHTLWTVSTVDGMALYGDRYKSIHYFAVLHNDGGSNTVCDEFHGGLGFLNNHMYLSAYLEQSLQLVDPGVALHYMEYTKYFSNSTFTDHLNNLMDGGVWTDILGPKFFGSNDPNTGIILDGRWGNAVMPRMTSDFMVQQGIDEESTFFPEEEEVWMKSSPAHLTSPYGLLRSPWNYNPTEYITRFHNVYRISNVSQITESSVVFRQYMGVQCADYVRFFETTKGQPLVTYLSHMEDGTHGLFHFTFGGVGGDTVVATCNSLANDYGFSQSNIVAMAISAQVFFKFYLAQDPDEYFMKEGKDFPLTCSTKPWQNNELTSTAAPGELGGPQCTWIDSYFESEDSVNEMVSLFFTMDPSNEHDSVVSRVEDMELDDKKSVMTLIANMFPFDGELAGSGAGNTNY